MVAISSLTPDLSLAKLGTREWALRQEMTAQRVALGAARLMLQAHLWGRGSAAGAHLSVFESLCLAAGGRYQEDGELAPPDEPAAAALLTRTCHLLGKRLTGRPPGDTHDTIEALHRLRSVSPEDHIAIQHLLATVHTPGLAD